jgi:hypothetical protein
MTMNARLDSRAWCFRGVLAVLVWAIVVPATVLGAERVVLGEEFTATW